MTVASPFLTEMDPRLQVQGSRDALGSQAVWAAVGRQLVGNLTLSSNDVAGFRTLLVGYGLAEDEAEMSERLRIFLRWEQVAAGCRVVMEDDPAPLGARRVRRRLAERTTLTISEEREHQIFADQRMSGLWVLYHRAARDSGLVDDRRRLTEAGRQLYTSWGTQLPGSIAGEVRRRGRQSLPFGRIGAPTEDASHVANLLVKGTVTDRSALLRHLVRGAGGGQQDRLASLLAKSRKHATLRDLPALRHQALAVGDDDLAHRLDQVLVAESVLHPAQAVFDALLVDGHGVTFDDFAGRIRVAWPSVPASVRAADFRNVIERLLQRAVGTNRAALWTEVAEAMADGDWPRALDRLVKVNADTMQQRGGAAWARTSERGVLDVRLRLGATLQDEADLLNGWRNPYYLTSLFSLHHDLMRGGR